MEMISKICLWVMVERREGIEQGRRRPDSIMLGRTRITARSLVQRNLVRDKRSYALVCRECDPTAASSRFKNKTMPRSQQ